MALAPAAAKKHTTGAMFYPLGVGKSENLGFFIHPTSVTSSADFTMDCVLFHEIVYTTKAYMRVISPVDYTYIEKNLERMDNVDVERLCGPLDKKALEGAQTDGLEATPTPGDAGNSEKGEKKRARPDDDQSTTPEQCKEEKANLARQRFLERQSKKKK